MPALHRVAPFLENAVTSAAFRAGEECDEVVGCHAGTLCEPIWLSVKLWVKGPAPQFAWLARLPRYRSRAPRRDAGRRALQRALSRGLAIWSQNIGLLRQNDFVAEIFWLEIDAAHRGVAPPASIGLQYNCAARAARV